MTDEEHPDNDQANNSSSTDKSSGDYEAEIASLRSDFETRLVAANLRTEAVRSGMIDLDGLKLADTSLVKLAPDGTAIGGREVIENLKRAKPWLFGQVSSSSVASVPPSQPPRLRTAMEMTDEEYAAARAALVARR